MSSKLLIAALCATLSMFTATSALASSRPCGEKGKEHQRACEHAITIYVGGSATARVLDLLRQDFNLVSLRDAMPSPLFLGPVVVSAADMRDPAVNKLLREAYAAGRTVALVAATQQEADLFTRFFGMGDVASCRPHTDGSLIALYGLQKSVTRIPALHSSYCLNGIGVVRDRRRDLSARSWLLTRFALSPPEPPLGTVSDDSSVDLQTLSSDVNCSYKDLDDTSGLNRQLQLETYINSVRSFDDNQDLYLVTNQLSIAPGNTTSAPTYTFTVQSFGATGVQEIPATLNFTEPNSSTVTVSYTNSESTTISGSVGFNQTQGVNASVGASVTVGESKTISPPPVTILNQFTVSPPFPKWTFKPTQFFEGQGFQAEANWLWTVDKADYGADGGEGTTGTITFRSTLSIDDLIGQPVCSLAPYPFPEWTVNPPHISSLSATTVSETEVRLRSRAHSCIPTWCQTCWWVVFSSPRQTM